MPATIWISNDAGHVGYEKARIIAGDDAVIRPLTLGNINPLNVDRLLYHLTHGVVEYVKPDDYLIISGTAIIPASALLLWLIMHGKCNILLWHAVRKEYKLYTLTLDDVKERLQKALNR